MTQLEMFAADPAPGWRPDPDKVRARLARILAEARAAGTLPWEPSRLSLFRTIFPDMTRWLPDEEAGRWRAEFAAELARLGAGDLRDVPATYATDERVLMGSSAWRISARNPE